jgi:uncharacterized membrane protein
MTVFYIYILLNLFLFGYFLFIKRNKDLTRVEKIGNIMHVFGIWILLLFIYIIYTINESIRNTDSRNDNETM